MKIVSIGEATVDYYPAIDKTFVGGISLNYAVHAKRCGADAVSLVSCVGHDGPGQFILNCLAQEQVDASYVTMMIGETGRSEIMVDKHGERYFPPNSYQQNVLENFALTPADLLFIQQHDMLMSRFDIAYTKVNFDKVVLGLEYAGKKIADFGDWYDYKGRHTEIIPYLPHLDLAFMSGGVETVAALLPYANQYKTQWVITMGDQGSVALVDGKVIAHPALPVPKIIDTTGCGDAFQAAFTVFYFKTNDIATALKAGAIHAARTLQHFGAI